MTTRTAGAGNSAAGAVGCVGVAVTQPKRRMDSREMCTHADMRIIDFTRLVVAVADNFIRCVFQNFRL